MTPPPGASAVADLLAASGKAARLHYLHKEGLADHEGLSWILDRASELVHDEPDAASQLAELCASAAETGGLHDVQAGAAYLHARMQAERGELEPALRSIAHARSLWATAGHAVQALRTDLGRMQILDDLGRHADAAAVGTRLLEELGSPTDLDQGDLDQGDLDQGDAELRRWLRAAALENVGVAYGFTGEHERALAAYAQAEQSYRELGRVDETARPRANRGIELLELGRSEEALEVLRSAEAVFASGGDRLWSAKCRGYIAQALEQHGELREALQLLESARVTLEELGAEVEAARLRLAIARVYLAVGLVGEARTEATAAYEAALALHLLHDAGTARFTLAQAYGSEGDLTAADREIKAAADLFQQVGDAQHRARATLATADIAAARGDRDEAHRLAVAAAEALARGGWLVPLAEAEVRGFDSAPSPETATAHLERAESVATQLHLPQLRYQCDLRAAGLHRRHGRDDDAERLLRRAMDQVDRLGASLPDQQLRRAFRAERRTASDDLIDLLLDRGRPADVAEALVIADRSKNQTMRELRARTVGARRRAGTGSALTDQIDRLRADLNAVYVALESAEPRRAEALRGRAADLEREINAVHLRTVDDVGPGPGPTISGAAAAPPGAAVEFHSLGEDLAVFVARGDAVEVRRLPGVLPEVERQLDRLTDQWSRFRMGSALTRRHLTTLAGTAREILAALYRLLLQPVAPLLEGALEDGLVIVPHRRLHSVPFAALHDGVGYLVERCPVSMAPDLTNRPSRPPRGGGALVVGVADARAPATEREALALAELLPGTRLLRGSAATAAAFARAVGGRAIVHLACHGLYRPVNPLFSSLRLADRWFAAAEVLDLDLEGALVTLSACESGRQGTGTAEPVGLAWAFLAAGADAVLASQWVVHDDVTADLMAAVYGHVTAGRAPAAALQQAQQAVMADHPHPFHWAPFAHVGPARRLGARR
ncbi:MAG: CHAT domain-containing protein [Actinomycetes bacterium]